MALTAKIEMNFCRRCGAELTQIDGHVFECANGHNIYANSAPATALILENDKGEVVVLERAVDPGKGRLDLPGGFCDGEESLEDSVYREIEEEVGVPPSAYGDLSFMVSGIDIYSFGGEQVPVLSAVFHALLTQDVTLKADDDAASAVFKPLTPELADSMFFPILQKALHMRLAAQYNEQR